MQRELVTDPKKKDPVAVDRKSLVRHRYHGLSMERIADAELAERLLDRDEEALRKVIATYGGVVFGMARRVLAEPTMAEEVAQDTFHSLWRRPGAYDPARGSLQGFLLGVARNKSIDLVRKEESQKRTKEALASSFEQDPNHMSEYEPGGIEDRHEVRDALAQLSPLQREAIVLAYFGGRTYREVATELGIPEGTAKTRLRDGLKKLKELMPSGRES